MTYNYIDCFNCQQEYRRKKSRYIYNRYFDLCDQCYFKLDKRWRKELIRGKIINRKKELNRILPNIPISENQFLPYFIKDLIINLTITKEVKENYFNQQIDFELNLEKNKYLILQSLIEII